MYVDLKVKLRKSLEELHEQEDMIVNIQLGLQQKLGLEPDYNNNLLWYIYTLNYYKFFNI